MRASELARRVFSFSLAASVPFVDVESQQTWTVLDGVLARQLDAPIDVAAVRWPNRPLTRAIAYWAYTQVDDDGDGLYAGIRYMSRLGDYECWAVFDGADVEDSAPPRAVESTDPVLQRVAKAFDLTLH